MAISSVIKYEGDNDVFVWKHPIEDFNTTSQLIVHESQEAILFRNGQALDLFGAGRYTLESENIPFLKRIINIPTGGETSFHCEVYFINKVHSMDILWGTSNPIPVKDAVYGIILPIGANGQLAVQIEDSRKFLVKMVGTISQFNQQTLVNYFRGILITHIKDYIANQFVREKITFLEVHSYLNSISDAIKLNLSGEFAEYGIKLINFKVNAIIVPENDPSYIRLKNAFAKKAEMGIIGYNYSQERTFDVLEKAADNEGAGASIMGAGLGLGMGVNIGNAVGGAMGNAMGNINISTQGTPVLCSNCKAEMPDGAKFCSGCGHKMVIPEAVVCPDCGKTVPQGKFCIECGHRFNSVCPKCGAELIPNASFCLGCGEKL